MTETVTRILSIDGGGIRGVIPARILVEVERRLAQLSGEPDARLADFFDLVAGTSTGGILTCAYLCPGEDAPGRPRFSARDAFELYRERGADIFSIPFFHRLRTLDGLRDEKHPADGLERVLATYFGETRLSELLKPCLVTAYDIERRRTWFFTQRQALAEEARDFYVCDVARATSAAPTFFETARVDSESGVMYPMIDGGIFASNPAMCAYAEARKLPGKPTARQMVMLSLGTGEVRRRYPYAEAKDWGMVAWLRPVLDMMMSGVAETVDHQLGKIYDAVGHPEQYLRIQPALPDDGAADMDNAQPDNIEQLESIAIEATETHAAELEAFVRLLV